MPNFDIYNFDLSQAWIECETFYHYLKNTYITLFGMSISLWALICSAYVLVSLVDVFLYFKGMIDIDDIDA